MKHTVTENTTLLDLLVKLHPDSPRTRIKRIMTGGQVRLRGRVITHHATPLVPGDEIEIAVYTRSQRDAPYTILYEDEFVVAIDKPPGINTSSADNAPSCADNFSQWYRDNSRNHVRVYVVHRLDKEVSGVLLFSKSEEVMEHLRDHWTETEKRYIAIVEGNPTAREGVHESWLIEDSEQRMQSLQRERPGAKLAITRWRTQRRIGPYTVLEITLHTGRKNQIRVHMQDLGCPIVGDRRYGADDEFIRRVRLHSIYLAFPHPVTGQDIVIESTPPKSFYRFRQMDEEYK